MLTRLSNGSYINLELYSSILIEEGTYYVNSDIGYEIGFIAVGINSCGERIKIINFCTSEEDCQSALDQLIASHQNTLVLGKTVTKEDVKIFLSNLPKSELRPFYDLILNRMNPKEDVDLWGDLSPLMGETKDAK